MRVLVSRLAQAPLALFIVLATVFIVMRKAGDPTSVLLPPQATQEQRARLRTELGLDQPLPVQFWDYLKDVAHGDFGQSIYYQRPAIGIVGERLWATMTLAVSSMVVAVIVSILLALLWRHKRSPAFGWVSC